MDTLEELSFQSISGVGAAKSCYIEALRMSRNGDNILAQKKLDEGYNYYLTGHAAHSKLLQQTAEKADSVKINLLVVHAEDQLMSAETIKLMVEEFMILYNQAE